MATRSRAWDDALDPALTETVQKTSFSEKHRSLIAEWSSRLGCCYMLDNQFNHDVEFLV